VLAFILFLKISLPDKEKTGAGVKEALKDARETAKRLNLSQEDIDAEIRAVHRIAVSYRRAVVLRGTDGASLTHRVATLMRDGK